MAKKPDYSNYNIPALQKFCEEAKLKFEWKNEAQGHAVISSEDIEAYVWVQRMSVMVRKRDGHMLSRPVMVYGSNKLDPIWLAEQIRTKDTDKPKTKSKYEHKKYPPLEPHFEAGNYGDGVVVMRIPKNTPPDKLREARRKQLNIARLHSNNYW